MHAPALLVVEDLHVAYGGILALKGISVTVKEGEIVTLIGANGAGKSTTLRAISGMLKPKQGRMEFRGKNLRKLKPHEIVRHGIVQAPEGRGIFPYLTVEENLRLGAYIRSDVEGIYEDMDRVYRLFPVLKERRKQFGGTLSGGEQQMLTIGRALLSRPKLILLDEPSLGLAPQVVERIFEVIQMIHQEGTSILLVEQNAYRALQIAHRGYVLQTGVIALEGKASDLMANTMVQECYLGHG